MLRMRRLSVKGSVVRKSTFLPAFSPRRDTGMDSELDYRTCPPLTLSKVGTDNPHIHSVCNRRIKADINKASLTGSASILPEIFLD